jgi:cation-transporting ATPase I
MGLTVTAPSAVLRTVLGTPFRVAGAVAERFTPDQLGGRRIWRAADRVHIGVPAVARERNSAFVADLEDQLSRHRAVGWVAVNGPLHTVVVGCDEQAPVDELVGIVESVERAHELAGADVSTHPGIDGAVSRAATALAADLVGISFAGVGRLLRATPLPVELTAAVSFLDTQPVLRGTVQRVLGRERAEVALAFANAAAHAISGSPTGLAVDAVQRGLQLAEARSRRACWSAAEPALTGTRAAAVAEPVTPERPQPLPPGPVERHSSQVGKLAVTGLAATTLLARSPRRGAGVAVSTIPRAAWSGREGFAATLGRLLSDRGVVVLDRDALRRLDRVDTVLVDADAVTTGQQVLGDLIPVGGGDPAELTTHAYRLFDGNADNDEFVLAPLERLDLRRRAGVRAEARLRRAGAAQVLGLARGRALRAVVGVFAEQAESADALAAAARRAGLSLAVARSPGAPAAAGADVADRVLPGGRRLVGSVRALQADGAVVLLVSRQSRALAAADVGVGVDAPDGRPPWGAHLLVGRDLDAAARVVAASGVARAVSHRGVQLARGGTVLGAAMAAGGRAPRLSRRSLLAVTAASAASLGQGVWAATEVGRRPVSPPVSRTPWHAMPADVVLRRLDVSTEAGLDPGEVRRRSRDEQTRSERLSIVRAFMGELANPLTPILAGGAALSAAIGAVTDATIVVGVSALSALVGAVQRVATDRAVGGLLDQSAVTARVLRAGAEHRLRADELVAGDVLLLDADDVVPADCRLVDARAMEVDESSLTGESLPVRKSVAPVIAGSVADRHCMLYEGTTVVTGHGRAVVVATGSATEVGRSLAAARGAAPVAGVEARLAKITRTTLPIALGSAAGVVAAGLVRGRPARDTLGAGVGLAVASVPEGLPFLVSAAQLAAARRLSTQGALVRNPRSIEALGRVDVLCFDKTGTLTEGRLELAAVSGGVEAKPLTASGRRHRAVVAAALRASPQPRKGRKLAHLTDRAVVAAAERSGIDRNDGQQSWRRLAALAFEPARAYHATLATVGESALLSVKGAPEVVIDRCGVDDRGRKRLLTESARLAAQGYRVLAVAERQLPGRPQLTDEAVTGLGFVGFLAFADPVRTAAAPSVRDLRDAGVQVLMITGDHPSTAQSIAEELDIVNGGRVVTGTDLDALDDDGLDALLPEVAVVARGTPAHKVRVVQAFQRLGRTVAMTGDGANDAPAIRLADVGIALGRRGTPAAHAAADLVVSDDRLETILAALVEGRAMWASVREAIGILVGGNLGEIAFTLFGAGLTGQSPLTARQLLLVNLLTDLAPALAVALRAPAPATADTLRAEGPEASLADALTQDIVARGAATTLGASSAWLAARLTGRAARARTVGLVALVGTQLGQTLVVGRHSRSVVAASVLSAGALAGVVQTPGVSQFFGCTPIGPVGWLIAGGAAAGATAGSLLLPSAVARVMPRLDGDAALPATISRLVRHGGVLLTARPSPAATVATG